ncbi:hypothetical protein DL93DRAFT_2171960 [Clavulina sp. PMI_390]|nr:hypothetical protein DL93DRAFT_2171960 [Clavulina sp. PMI_390]
MFWKFLDLSWGSERTAAWAERAGENVPLHFHYNFKARLQAALLRHVKPFITYGPNTSPESVSQHTLWTRRIEHSSKGLELVQLIANNHDLNPRCASLSITCSSALGYNMSWSHHLIAFPNLKSLEISPSWGTPPTEPIAVRNSLGAFLNGRILPALGSLRMLGTVTTNYDSLAVTLTCLHLVDAPATTRDALLINFGALRELSIVRGIDTTLDPPSAPQNTNLNTQNATVAIDPLSRFQVPKLEVLYIYDPAPQLLALLITREQLPKLTTLVVGRLGTALGLFKPFLRHCNSVTSLRIKDDEDAQITLLEIGRLRRSDSISSASSTPIENTPFFSNLVELEVYDLPWPYSHLVSAAEQPKALLPFRPSKKHSRNFNGLKEFLKVWTAHRSSILERMHLRSTIGDPMRSPEEIPAWVWDSTDVLTVDGQPWDILEKRDSLNLNEGE